MALLFQEASVPSARPKTLLVTAHDMPSPQYCQATIVYVMLSRHGFVRIGETDDVVRRLTVHRPVNHR